MSTEGRSAPLTPSPLGVMEWLSRPTPSLQRSLIEALLGAGGEGMPDVRHLSVSLGRPVAEVARALFELHRNRCLRSDGHAIGILEPGPAGLEADLAEIAGSRGSAVLADSQGRCIAAHGWSGPAASRVARLAMVSADSSPMCVNLYLSSGRFVVACNRQPDPEAKGWVRLAARLLRGGADAPVGVVPAPVEDRP